MGDVKPIIAVTGMKREASVLAGLGVNVITGGGTAERLARELAEQSAGAAGIISFGMAGALDAGLRIGDWVVGTSLTGSWEGHCDGPWAEALAARMPDARRGCCYADGRLIADPAQKRAIGQNLGALVVDMESHIAAQAAAAAGVPFAILRCVSDEIDTALPPAIAVAMRPDGGIALGAVLGSIVKNPGQLPELLRNSAGFSRAFAALRQGAELAGPHLAFDRR